MHELADVALQIAAVRVSVVARVGLPIRAEVIRVCVLAGIFPVEVFHAPGEKDEKQPHP
jgi:C4-dicarboxylate transporter